MFKRMIGSALQGFSYALYDAHEYLERRFVRRMLRAGWIQ
jgi:hypothetical protein